MRVLRQGPRPKFRWSLTIKFLTWRAGILPLIISLRPALIATPGRVTAPPSTRPQGSSAPDALQALPCVAVGAASHKQPAAYPNISPTAQNAPTTKNPRNFFSKEIPSHHPNSSRSVYKTQPRQEANPCTPAPGLILWLAEREICSKSKRTRKSL